MFGDVGVRSDPRHAVGREPLDDLFSPLFDVLGGEVLLSFLPDVDACRECADVVPARVAGRECRIEVDVWFDKWRRDELPSSIVVLVIVERCRVALTRWHDAVNHALLNLDVHRLIATGGRARHDELCHAVGMAAAAKNALLKN